MLLLGVIYLFDFLTLGALKKIKNKWFANIYYPIYRFFGWVTFAGVYRGIYYSLIQYASKKVMMFITPIYIIGALWLLNQGYSAHTLFPENGGYRLQEELIGIENYQDEFVDRMIIRSSFIESFIVPADQNFIKYHIPLTESLEDSLINRCHRVAPFNERGIHWRKWVQTNYNQVEYDSSFNYHQNAENILNCISERISISIDSLTYPEKKFYFGKVSQPTDYAVLITVLDASSIPRGNHNLVIESKLFGDDLIIPFWRD